MSKEVFGLKGPLFNIGDPLGDGNDLVQEKYPKCFAEGSTSHWSWSYDWTPTKIEILAESWYSRGSWKLRIKCT